ATLPLIERVLSGEGGFDPVDGRRTFSVMMTDYASMRLHGALAAVIAEAPGVSVEALPLPERPMESERDLITHDFVVTVPGIGIDGQSVSVLHDEYVCLIDPGNPALVNGEL